MLDPQKDGGPAFPCTVWSPRGHMIGESMGLSLRDWFAGQAGASILGGLVSAGQSLSPEDAAKVAVAAYFHADAMLAAREASK